MRIALYTVNIGGYDTPIDPTQISGCPDLSGVDLYMITDHEEKISNWEMKVPMVLSDTARKTSRHPKINSHLYFPNYDYTIYIDSNMFISEKPQFYIDEFLKEHDIALHKNPYRSCAYAEAKEIRDVLKYEDPDIVDAEVDHLRFNGYPENNGLGACHLLVRRNTPQIAKLNDEWWSMVAQYSYRDQLSFDYSCYRTNTKYKVIEPYKKYTMQQPHAKEKVTF
tara:strand:+ start:22014 stop:22682 length:669 start_codon:yes stop_codon:yes gene_type:complete